LAGCSQTAPQAPPTSSQPATSRAPSQPGHAAFRDLVAKARLNFARQGDELVATSGMNVVRARSDGSFTFQPVDRRTDTKGKPRTVLAAPATLATVAIGRQGGAGMASGKLAPSASARASIDRGAAVESVESVAEGLEHAWRFDRRPAGSGDLVVRV